MNAIEKARASAETAAQELAKLEAVEAEKAAQVAAQRAQRTKEYAAQTVATLRQRDDENRAAEDAARERYFELISAEPWFIAFCEYRAHRMYRSHIMSEAQNAKVAIGEDPMSVPDNRMYDSPFMEDLAAFAEQRASNIAEAIAAKREAEREAYVSGGEA
ncbi:hypothetical protein ACWCXB_10430 [Streptomyces sp. NPDC001514]